MDRTGLIQIAALIILIFLSGYFSAAETALTTVNRVSLKALADEGDKKAAQVLQILEDYGKMLSTILICNNIVNIGASALVTVFVIHYISENAVTAGTMVLTVLVLIFGEITPKSASAVRALKVAKQDAAVIWFLMNLLTPVIFLINLISGGILKLQGIDPDERAHLTENEFKTYVEVGHEDGVIESDEKEIIYNTLDFGDSVAKDIMIPRADMVCVPVDADYDEVIRTFREDMFTRLPVYEDDSDNIIGLINIKDFIMMEDMPANKETFSVRSILREAYYTVEIKKIADLLKEMRQNSVSVAFVLSEYGNTVGMLTLEDMVEEIVGEIHDEYDEDEREQLKKYNDKTYLVEASMKLDDINDAIGSRLDSENYDSIGGLMIEKLGRFPKNEEKILLEDGTSLEAKGIRQNRIVKVLIRLQ